MGSSTRLTDAPSPSLGYCIPNTRQPRVGCNYPA
ncbi:hypothetical protein FRAAL6175 [Frankia alni ACN14a]|uniref:Uncharacterized protein n=1 Tax=Frankia alni (strain DSM 45986 / CECT 9034 / ACN14a) TaxID=326424 RepID=Q0RCM6_FRAAA|nr:hypothetical protein FRAAL6175 [Frankia alni ACN14a]